MDAFIPHWICIDILCSLDIATLPGSICHLFMIQLSAFVWRYSYNIYVDDSLLWFGFIHDNNTVRGTFSGDSGGDTLGVHFVCDSTPQYIQPFVLLQFPALQFFW